MDNNFYSQDKIDAFLSGKLSAAEKLMFEENMAKDPLVGNEIKLQDEIVNHLKEHRKAELKNRLNNINASTSTSYAGLIVAAGVAGALLLTTASYFYFFNRQETQKDQNIVSLQQPENGPSVFEAPVTESTPVTSETSSDNTVSAPSPLKIKANREAHISQLKKLPEHETSSNETLSAQASEPIIQGFDSEDFNSGNSTVSQKGEIQGSDAAKLDNISVKIAHKKNKDFHYQFFSNKLFLYGKFDEKPYEILELNNRKGRDLYLKYEGNYYSLKSNQIEIAPLKEIHDKDIILELDALRK